MMELAGDDVSFEVTIKVDKKMRLLSAHEILTRLFYTQLTIIIINVVLVVMSKLHQPTF